MWHYIFKNLWMMTMLSSHYKELAFAFNSKEYKHWETISGYAVLLDIAIIISVILIQKRKTHKTIETKGE